jgi:hypothetical protein
MRVATEVITRVSATACPGLRRWRRCSITVSIAARVGEVTGPVRITHPFHPLVGREIDLVMLRAQWGEERVFYRDRQGHRASLPARWTSLAPEDPYVAVGASRAQFRVKDLIDLAALLQGLRP